MTAANVLPKELGRMIEWRRTLHANPEVSGNEYQTRAFILDQLKRLEIPARTFETHAGILATIEGKGPGGVIALRADMDALPITENNDLPHRSQNAGVMHACGHDGHMAMPEFLARHCQVGVSAVGRGGAARWRTIDDCRWRPGEPQGGHDVRHASLA